MSSVKLSIVVIMYNMQREARRSLYSLSKNYQEGIDDLDYEVIVVDNGSAHKVEESLFSELGPSFKHEVIKDASPSPVSAVNSAVNAARGEIICIMIDGAHILTPGVLRYGLRAFKYFENPVVIPHYFYLGPGSQRDSIQHGYNQEREDRLLESINWPQDGYRLFEIGQIYGEDNRSWFMPKIESNCIFLSKSLFDSLGGMDEKFDIPGGGFANPDLFYRAARSKNATVVGLLGEGTFHQVHNGITTNDTPRNALTAFYKYAKQYEEIRGEKFKIQDFRYEYIGHMPSISAELHAINNSYTSSNET
ncbi:MAG: glycosyltransferase family A protein [Pseudomonadota bacterium]